MEDAQRFDPVKGLSTRVLTRLEDAPELDLDEEVLPAPGEQVRVWYSPENYSDLERRNFRVQTEVFEVVQWYKRSEESGIVALICREVRAPFSVQVLYGDDWQVDEELALEAAIRLLSGRTDELLDELDKLGSRSRELEELRKEAKRRKAERIERESSRPKILLVHRADPQEVEKYAVDQARKRALELMADQQASVSVRADDVETREVEASAGLLLVEKAEEQAGDGAGPTITAAQAELADVFIQSGRPVWVWRESQGHRVSGAFPCQNSDDFSVELKNNP